MRDMDAALKFLQTLRWCFLASIVIYAGIAARVGPPSGTLGDALFFKVIVAVAILSMLAMFALRRVMVISAEAILAGKPDDPNALARWKAGHIVSYAISESIALYGIVLRFVGFTAAQVLPFFIAGFILILFFAPRRPSNAIG